MQNARKQQKQAQTRRSRQAPARGRKRAANTPPPAEPPAKRRRIADSASGTLPSTRSLVPRSPGSGLSSSCAAYIQALLADRTITGIHLPSPNYTGPYQRMRVLGRFQLFTGAAVGSAANNSSFVINPYTLWATNLFVSVQSGSSTNTQQWASIWQSTTTATNSGLPQPCVNAGATGVTIGGQITTSTNDQYVAWVRNLGVKMRIIYTGTVFNQGGEIRAVHNSVDVPLSGYNCTLGTAGVGGADTNYSSSSSLDQGINLCSIHSLQDVFEFNWRPQTIEFHQVTNSLGLQQAIPTGDANPVWPTHTQDYAQQTAGTVGQGADPAPLAWKCGAVINPASTAGAASPLNYWVEVESEMDVNLTRSNVSTAPSVIGQTPIQPSHMALSDPVSVAHVHNALSHLHASRMASNNPVGSKSLPAFLTTAERRVGRIASSAVTEAAASQLARVFS